LNPNLAEAHAAYGLALSLRKKWTEATQAFERALALDPRSFEAAYFHGRASLAHGEYEKAVQLGFAHREWVDNDSDWDSVRDDPRFERFARRSDLRLTRKQVSLNVTG